jgi:hypothetical protein
MSSVPRSATPLKAMAARAFWLLLCGLLPLVALYYALGPVAFGDRQADFHFNYYYAAEAIRAGENFYPSGGFIVRGPDDLIIDYVYPPLVAIATIPWTLLPVGLAESLFQLLLVVAFVATLAILGVRDWRCWPRVSVAASDRRSVDGECDDPSRARRRDRLEIT